MDKKEKKVAINEVITQRISQHIQMKIQGK